MIGLILVLQACTFLGEEDMDARMDLDGDGSPRPVDCDDNDRSVGPPIPLHADRDNDGHAGEGTEEVCPGSEGYHTTWDDCDDTVSSVFPGAPELCNGADDDCDDEIDEGPPSDAEVLYRDADGDGYGDPDEEATLCPGTSGYASNDLDCDDDTAAAHPGNTEVCNDGLDNDCSGGAEECILPANLDLGDADGIIYGVSPDQELGRVAWVGDVDGDGGETCSSERRGTRGPVQEPARPTSSTVRSPGSSPPTMRSPPGRQSGQEKARVGMWTGPGIWTETGWRTSSSAPTTPK